MSDEGIKIARAVAVPGVKLPAWTGGQWTAGERFPKAPRFASVARDEGFNPNAVSAVWLRDEKQVGWFAFDGKPQRGIALAWFAAQRMTHGKLPWLGIFNLGEIWWYVACDEKGAIHPSFDVAVGRDERTDFEATHSTELGSFMYDTFCGTPEESWEWLLSDSAASPPHLVPVMAAARARRLASMAVIGVVALGAGGEGGLHMWKHHEQQLQDAAAARARAQTMQLRHAQLAAEVAANGALTQRVRAYWSTIPRPWTSAPSWRSVLNVANAQLQVASMHGWRLAKVKCAVHGDDLSIVRTWRRSTWATSAAAPRGALSSDGNTVTEQTLAHLKPREWGATKPALPQQATLARSVTAQSQLYSTLYIVHLSPFAVYRPPVPGFVPKKMAAKYTPPVLWSTAKFTLSADLQIPPDLSNTRLFAPTNAPAQVQIDLLPKSVKWKLEGTEYAKP